MRVNIYRILCCAVEEGAIHGYRRAHKHTETPTESAIIQEIITSVMDSIHEVIEFEEVKDEENDCCGD